MVGFTAAISGLLLAGAANAVPTNKKPVCKNATLRDANFDDLTGIPGNLLNTIPTPYKGIQWTGIDFSTVVATGTGLQPGIRPHSGLNYAAVNTVTQLGGTSMMTTFYPGSKISTFDLHTFYYACATMAGQGAAAIPAACNVQITGYKGSDNAVSEAHEVCSHQYQYNPTTALGTVDQSFSQWIPDCHGLNFAVITYSPVGGQAATGALLALVLDDVKYQTCSK